MNWGYGIMFTIATFVAAMVGMVYVAMQQTNDMVDKNYYAQELKYQQLIDAAHNLNSVSTAPLLVAHPDRLEVNIPETLCVEFKNGRLEFLRNDDQQKDITVDFLPDAAGVFLLEKSGFHPGQYKARISWESQGKSYYKEQEVTIQP